MNENVPTVVNKANEISQVSRLRLDNWYAKCNDMSINMINISITTQSNKSKIDFYLIFTYFKVPRQYEELCQ